MKKGYWILIAIFGVFAAAILVFQNLPKYEVAENGDRLTMQQYLERDGVSIPVSSIITMDFPFQDVFQFVVVIDHVSFDFKKYGTDYPEDRVWCTGKLEETRCYIFTNRVPPRELRELYRYIN